MSAPTVLDGLREDLAAVAAGRQRRAADPTGSAFVTANAGSGKTKTLIDRVARLLLAGVEPQAILCVTYTKAAASEMQRRLFGLLGDWSIFEDAKLAPILAALEERTAASYDSRALRRARGLFAKALETPGGLKIQTIHAFCEKLLRRFPLEAGVSPGFKVMDDAAAAFVAQAAKAAVARHAMAGDGAVARAYARFSVALDFQSFQTMFAEFESRRGPLRAFFDAQGGLEGARAWVLDRLELEPDADPETLAQDAMAAADHGVYRRAAALLATGGKTDVARAEVLAAIAEGRSGFDAALGCFFTAAGDAARWIESSAKLKTDDTLRYLLLAEQSRLERARERVRAAEVAAETLDALTLAEAYLAAYRVEKTFAGAMDFADLVEKTCQLISSRPAAAWVLYKLDGGIEHILVDEAQDTAPDQWTIVRALTEEFFSGAGVRPDVARSEVGRGLFIVGDEKQSIYSFQGARPEQLTREFEFHRDRAADAGFRFERVDLLTSFRSAPQVLSFVDATFSPPELAQAIQPRVDHEEVLHEAMRKDDGCVDIWPLEVEPQVPLRLAWDAPLDAEGEESANRRLARRIACEIRALIDRGDAVLDKDTGKPRPANAGDVLILVRRRRALFEDILRALKQEGVPVAGADRLALSAHILFDDMLALARFVLFPGDDLTLANLLKSPFCRLTDDSLYDLAHGRGKARLWDVLNRRAGEQAVWADALAVLERARAEAAVRQPFEFYTQMLGAAGADGVTLRRRLIARLGEEAQEALDEYLAQVLAAEARGIHDLEAMAHAFAALDITVKREMEAPAGQVRVMTAHGAKGLEAPIVFLPETTLSQTQRGSPLMETPPDSKGHGGFLWCAAKARDCDASAAARAHRARREEDETWRLLYVALTRARDRLVICGRLPARAKPENVKGWWGALDAALGHERVAPHVAATTCGDIAIQRFGPDPRPLGRAARVESPVSAAPPAWIRTAAAPEAFSRLTSPSDLGEDARVASPSPLATWEGLGRFRRGDLIHRLLQLLPDLAAADRAAGAMALLAREPDLTDAQRREMAEAAMAVLADARFAEVFGPGSRAEVAIAGGASGLPAGLRISGRIDRLVVLADRVLVVDFKTNRPSPARIEDADPAYLRQMAIYAAVLADVFPGRAIAAALVWTDGPKLTAVPENLIARALADLGRAA